MNEMKEVLPLYIGQKIQYPDIDGSIIIARFTGLTVGDGIETTYLEIVKDGETKGDYLAFKDNGNHKSNALNAKLILRPLSSMTEEEMSKIGITDYEFMLANFEMGNEMNFTASQFFFLLSKGFDIFNLHERGLCLYESDLK